MRELAGKPGLMVAALQRRPTPANGYDEYAASNAAQTAADAWYV